ncbi:hypothetical protein [Streptomyces sp. NPDC001275]
MARSLGERVLKRGVKEGNIGRGQRLLASSRTHRRDFTKAYDWLREHPEDAEVVRAKGRTFGAGSRPQHGQGPP